MLESVDPVNEKVIARFPEHRLPEVAAAIRTADRVFEDYRGSSLAERAGLLRRAAALLRDQSPEHAALITREMGKPIAQSRAEIEKCAAVCDYYAEHGAGLLADMAVQTDARTSFVAFQPLGVVLAVMPWNFPYWQVFRFAAPNLMAGNAALLKHSSNVSGCALAIERLLHQAGFPNGLFRTLLIPAALVEAVISQSQVRAVTLTGSTPAGRAVAAAAGRNLKKTVLELGGSDPYVVLADADLPAAVRTCVDARLVNSGQSCIAAKRFIIVDRVYPEFEKLFAAEMRQRRMGDPFDETNDIGPLARTDLRDELHQQVARSVVAGACPLVGGLVPESKGAWFPPTILTNVGPGMPAFDEELFGPVASLIRARDEAAAIRVANRTSFGLGAAVFTRDVGHGTALARDRLQAGSCFVNAAVKSDPRLPFGGINESGYGRELGLFGIREFVNIKTVFVA
jgi:succinate-semialdehyde dehydrogenase/glutarate-semialdehyde dehydrogenase